MQISNDVDAVSLSLDGVFLLHVEFWLDCFHHKEEGLSEYVK